MKNKIIIIITLLALTVSGITAYYTWNKTKDLNQVDVYHSTEVMETVEPESVQLTLKNDGITFQSTDESYVILDNFAVPVTGDIRYDGNSLQMNGITAFVVESTETGVSVKHYADTEDGTVALGTYGNGEKQLCLRRNDEDTENTVQTLIEKVKIADQLSIKLDDWTLNYDSIILTPDAIKLTINESTVYLYPFNGDVEILTLDEETGLYSGDYTDKTTQLSAFVINNLAILADSEETVKTVLGL